MNAALYLRVSTRRQSARAAGEASCRRIFVWDR
jgi:DNA invertase Pin-like site-specific DNA recombinase